MAAQLKWDGDKLMLGKTKMAEVRTRAEGIEYDYVIGPGDKVSEPYQDKDDARQDCFNEVLRLLRAASGIE
jgi:hypothetical protein